MIKSMLGSLESSIPSSASSSQGQLPSSSPSPVCRQMASIMQSDHKLGQKSYKPLLKRPTSSTYHRVHFSTSSLIHLPLKFGFKNNYFKAWRWSIAIYHRVSQSSSCCRFIWGAFWASQSKEEKVSGWGACPGSRAGGGQSNRNKIITLISNFMITIVN